MIDLSTATFIGPEATDIQILQMLPEDYRAFLLAVNGCALFGGGLHIRGACEFPDWHSLRQAWIGESTMSAFFPAVQASDIPFAQDVLGDQFLIRDGFVFRLSAETGDLFDLRMGWRDFFSAAEANPVEILSLQPLLQYTNEGGRIEPGQLLSVYPPFCTVESANGVSLKAVPALERIRFLAEFSAKVGNLPDLTRIRMRVE